MSIIKRVYDRKDSTTAFYHSDTGKALCRLGVKLSRDDHEQLFSLFDFIFRQGEHAGSEQRALEIRIALGLEPEK
uniref:hypothetical protein n=1 Tax=Yersiniaceae TaxID=1903411 RepID=UPI001F4C1E01|nr:MULTISPECIES: hypothetical protein [Yersiniaceae]ULG17053.1 hypothetical protein 1772p2_00067 [Serratia proteamaculans]ULG20096.1 hypothetical protein 49p3_00002 [Yersinia frederiksenii]